MAESKALAALRAEYDELCGKRDATNKLNAPLEAELAAVLGQIEALKPKAADLAEKIDANRAAAGHRAAKKRIGKLADAIMALKREG